MATRYLISGCSSGGKSTLLDALRASGFHTVSEPGRRIVAEQRAGNGRALPWVDMEAFARRALDMARADLERTASLHGPVFFDRGVIDAAVALERSAGVPLEESLGAEHVYCAPVFVTPPWPDLFQTDSERRHGFEDALAEYEALTDAFRRLGYATRDLPKSPVSERMSFVLDVIGETS